MTIHGHYCCFLVENNKVEKSTIEDRVALTLTKVEW